MRRRWVVYAAMFLLLVAGVIVLLPRDDVLLAQVIEWSNEELRSMFGANDQGRAVVSRSEMKAFARELYFWGDFLTGTLIVSGALGLAGVIFRRRRWQVAALAVVLAAASAGITANVFRLTTGRPRPVFTSVPDGFYGIRFEGRYHAFPSGHSATAAGTATALLVVVPVVGVPVCAGAALVMWSRLYLRAHRPADVWAGAMLGIIFGTSFGLAARAVARLPKRGEAQKDA